VLICCFCLEYFPLQGRIKKGEFLTNLNSGKKIKVPRLVKMHSNEMQEIDEVHTVFYVYCMAIVCSSLCIESASILYLVHFLKKQPHLCSIIHMFAHA